MATRELLALLAMATCSAPARGQVPEQAKPTTTIEAGSSNVSDGSFKAGEYNGLQKKGAVGIGNIDARGGADYTSDSALRWRLKANDLGLETRGLSAVVGAQGRYRLNFGYDELRRNRSDSYQTPFDGGGSTALRLPGTWLVPTVAGVSGSNGNANVSSARGLFKPTGESAYVDSRATSATFGGRLSPNAVQIAQVNAAANADGVLFRHLDLSTKRTIVNLGLDFSANPKWGFDASFRPEHKDGLKPMGTVSRSAGGDISAIIPDVIDTNTNQVESHLNFRGAKSFVQAGYYGSYFKNNVRSMSWQNWASGPGPAATVQVMSSTPDNTFNNFSLTGGYNLSPRTKVVARGSYGRTTQNVSFLTDSTTPVVPVSSLDGLVVSTGFDAKLTARPAKKVSVVASYKYDDRDNRTPIHIFQYADAGEAAVASAVFAANANNPLGALLAQNANANRPYSKRVNLASADADLALGGGYWLRGGYDFERNNRSCPGSWINCADAAITNENTLRAEWRAQVSDDFTGRVTYGYSVRRTPFYDENAFLALVPYANVTPTNATTSAYAFLVANGWNGWGPVSGFGTTTGNMNVFFPSNNALANGMYGNGNRISELAGMRRYYVADRNRNKLRASADWQATTGFSLESRLDYTNDDYLDSTYGLQSAKGWAANVEGTFAPSQTLSLGLFYTYEDQRQGSAGNTYTANSNASTIAGAQPGATGLSGNACDGYTTLQQRNNNNKIDPCLNWFTDRRDKVNSVGITLLGKNVRDTKLDLSGNFVLSRSRSDTNATGGNWANNILIGPAAAPTTVAAYFLAASALPTVSTDNLELRLNGTYAVSPHQSIRALYTYMRMKSSDWIYDAMQIDAGTPSGVLPSLEQAFNYSVSVVGLSYVLGF